MPFKSKEARRKYFQKYWKTKGDKVNKRRRKQYATDPEVRQKAIEASRAHRRKVSESKGIISATERILSGRVHVSMGQAAEVIGQKPGTLRKWVNVGAIPKRFFRVDKTGRRWFVRDELDLLKKAVTKAWGNYRDLDDFSEIVRKSVSK